MYLLTNAKFSSIEILLQTKQERKAALSVWNTALIAQKNILSQRSTNKDQEATKSVQNKAVAMQKDATIRAHAQDAALTITTSENFPRGIKRDAENIDPNKVKRQRFGQDSEDKSIEEGSEDHKSIPTQVEIFVRSPPGSPAAPPPHLMPAIATHAGSRMVLTKPQKKKAMVKIVDTLEDAIKFFLNTHFRSRAAALIGDNDFGPLLHVVKRRWRSVRQVSTTFVRRDEWKGDVIIDIAHSVRNSVQHEKEPDPLEPSSKVPWNTDGRVICECIKAVMLSRFLDAQKPLDDAAISPVSKKVEVHLLHVLMRIKLNTPETFTVQSIIEGMPDSACPPQRQYPILSDLPKIGAQTVKALVDYSICEIVDDLEIFICRRQDSFGHIPSHPSVYDLCQQIYSAEERQYRPGTRRENLPIQKQFTLRGGILCGQIAKGFEFFYHAYRDWSNPKQELGATEVLGVITSAIEIGEAIGARKAILNALHEAIDTLAHVFLYKFDLYGFNRFNSITSLSDTPISSAATTPSSAEFLSEPGNVHKPCWPILLESGRDGITERKVEAIDLNCLPTFVLINDGENPMLYLLFEEGTKGRLKQPWLAACSEVEEHVNTLLDTTVKTTIMDNIVDDESLTALLPSDTV